MLAYSTEIAKRIGVFFFCSIVGYLRTKVRFGARVEA